MVNDFKVSPKFQVTWKGEVNWRKKIIVPYSLQFSIIITSKCSFWPQLSAALASLHTESCHECQGSVFVFVMHTIYTHCGIGGASCPKPGNAVESLLAS